MLDPHPRTAPEKFAAILLALGWAVAKQTGWGLSLQLIAVIVSRISRVKNRFAGLAARIAAGTFRPRRPAATPRRQPETPRKPPPPNPLPNRPGWLLPLESSAVVHRGQMEALLQDADMVALMQAAPEAMARALRPLCRMLRLDLPPALLRASPDPPPVAVRPRAPRPRRPRAPPPPPPAAPPPPSLKMEFASGRPHLVWT